MKARCADAFAAGADWSRGERGRPGNERLAQVAVREPLVPELCALLMCHLVRLLKSYIATGGTLSVSDAPGASVRDAPNNIASKLRVDPSISVLQSLEKCVKEKDAAWMEKFIAAGGAAATLDVIALKEALEPAQKTKDDWRIEDICAQAMKKITDSKVTTTW